MKPFTNLNSWRTLAWLAYLSALMPILPTQAQETTCARVKIEIKQELPCERQAFDVGMTINNTTDTSSIDNMVIFGNKLGTPA